MCAAKPDAIVTVGPPRGLRGLIQFHLCGACAREVTPADPDRRELFTWQREYPNTIAPACERAAYERYTLANQPRN